MASPSSGLISLSMISQEFGVVTPPYNLSDFYRGGLFVPDVSANFSIPTSGTISLSMFYGAKNQFESTYEINSNTTNLIINPTTVSGYIEGVSIINIIIKSGYVLGSDSVDDYALVIDGFSNDDIINLTIESGAYIVGKGGRGADSVYGDGEDGEDGEDGGDAMHIRSNVNITNYGIIGSGGGGGGSGGGAWFFNFLIGPPSIVPVSGAGGGGAGWEIGLKGNIVEGNKCCTPPSEAGNGTLLSGGSKGLSARDGTRGSGHGGNGGDLGEDGEDGQDEQGSHGPGYGGKGGSAGNAVDGNSYIIWNNLGDVRGNKIN